MHVWVRACEVLGGLEVGLACDRFGPAVQRGPGSAAEGMFGRRNLHGRQLWPPNVPPKARTFGSMRSFGRRTSSSVTEGARL